jgi:hypothetical protein
MKKNVRIEGHDKPHFIFYDEVGLATGQPVGTVIGLVTDPDRYDPMHRLLIEEINRRRVILKCVCNPSCKARYIMRIVEEGQHA